MSLTKALYKINLEMEEKKNSYVTTVGNFLKEYLEMDPTAAEKILVEDKNITNSINEMKKVAKENAVDGVGVLSDAEGFEIVLKYFGIEAVDPAEAKEDTFDVKLDDFL